MTDDLLVWGEEGPERHPAICVDEPEVIAQIGEDEHQARFMGEWDGERWRIGKRLLE